jgi:predicted Rossmann fold nucleotide-binding protein DprA/Smf involved in DNA uptake
MNARDILITLDKKYNHDWNNTYAAIKKKEIMDSSVVISDDKAITLLDENYPISLKNAYRPPFVFYYEGDLNYLNVTNLCLLLGDNVFGIPEDRVMKIVNDVVIIGDNKLKLSSSKEGASRIAAALCNKVIKTDTRDIVSECLTIALTLGKDIYVKPTTEPSFNNKLIKEGAFLCDCLEDIIEGEN